MSSVADQFIAPPTPGPNKDYSANNVYKVGETVTLSWVKSFSRGTLTLSQDNKPGDQTGGPSRNIIENVDVVEYEWAVSYFGLDPKVNNVFYLGFGDGSQGFSSHYFNITSDANSDSTSISPSVFTTTATSIFTSSLSTTTTGTSTSTLTTDTKSPSNESLTAGGIAGITVGVTLGTILVAAGLGFLVWHMRNKRKTVVNSAYDASQYPYPQAFIPVEQPQQLMSTPIVEMEGIQGSQKPSGNHEMP
ncbi:hypothetical protein F4680DRAFT_316744 [Xylaria scruposa]|nr:hypothetical protein F4680DRAFT_316744 [Xylaria scruposa]